MNLIITKISGGCFLGTNNSHSPHNAIREEDLSSCVGTISIPYSYNGLKVLKIGTHAFSYLYNITHVQIHAEIISIEPGAFVFCRNLMSINIPASVREIKNSALGLGNYSINGSPPSSGSLNVYIESPSQLTYIERHGICCKSVIHIYYCGSHTVQGSEDSLEDADIIVFSHNKLTFSNIETTESSFSCINQKFLQI